MKNTLTLLQNHQQPIVRATLGAALLLLALTTQAAESSYADKPLFYASGVQPNVALLMDSSGSMTTQDAGFGPLANNCATTGTFGSTTSQLSRAQALRTAACKVVQDNGNAMRIGVFRYNAGGADVTPMADWGTDIGTLKTTIGGLPASGTTPIVRSLYAVGSKGYGGELVYNTPIQYRCQKNYVVFFTDGEPNDAADETTSPTFATAADTALDSDWPGSDGLYNWDNYPDTKYSNNSYYSGTDFYPWLDDAAQFIYDLDAMQVGSAPIRACPPGSLRANTTDSRDCSDKSWDDPEFPIQNVVTFMVGFGAETNIELMRDAPLVNRISVNGLMVDTANDTLTIPNHGLKTDDYVHYYANRVPQDFLTTASASVAGDTVTPISGDTLNLAEGDELTYSNGGGTNLAYSVTTPGPTCGDIGGDVDAGNSYYVARLTADTFRLSPSAAAANACAGLADGAGNVSDYCRDMGSRGTAGTGHTFTRSTTSVGFYTTGGSTSTTPVNIGTETITRTNHGLSDGDQVTYYCSSGCIGGLSNGTTYYAVSLSANTFKLASSLANVATCKADTTSPYAACVDLTSRGNNGTAQEFRRTAVALAATFTATGTGNSPVYINNDIEKITLAAHGFSTGDRVAYTCAAGPATTTAYTDTTYFARNVVAGSPGQFQLSLTPGGTPVNISNAGTVAQTFAWTKLASQPVIPGLQAYVTDLPPDASPSPGSEDEAKGKYWVEKISNDVIKLYECGQYCESRDTAAVVNLTGTTGEGILSTGPGRFYKSTSAADLSTALTSAFTDIRGAELSFASLASNSSEVNANSRIYQARFNTADWSGDVRSLEIVNGEVDETAPEWRAADPAKLPVHGSRNIKTRNDTAGAINFTTTNWASLTPSQQAALSNGGTATVGQNVLNWTRGQAVATYRVRENGNIGDVLNSSLVYVGQSRNSYGAELPAVAGTGQDSYNTFKTFTSSRVPMVYGGSNGGMLHGFNASGTAATQGVEVFAFVPESVYMDWIDLDDDGVKDAAEPAINKFFEVAQPYYGLTVTQPHRYFVDGTPATGDAYFTTAKAGLPADSWHTVLVGGLGKGGRSVYALDITDPATSFVNGNVLWEFDDSNSGDMGYSYSRPVIARLGTSGGGGGQWVAIFGNGYDSRADQARLFIVNIETGALLHEITLGPINNANGLSSVSVLTDTYDFDGDNDKVEALAVYAGDLQGNVWKVNINGGDDLAFTMPTGLTTPFFVAQDAGGIRQAITSEITLNRYAALDDLDGSNREAGVMLFFGTGAYFRNEDQSYNYPTSGPEYDAMYGLWDKGDAASVAMSELVEQQMGTTVFNGVTYRTATGNDVNYEGIPPPVQRGWFMKLAVTLPTNDYRGERTVFSPTVAGPYLVFSTVTPADADPCRSGGSGTLYVVNAMTGGANAYSPFDLDGIDDNENEDISIIGIDFAEVLLSKPLVLDNADNTLPGDGKICVGKSDGTVECKPFWEPPPPTVIPTSLNSGRMSWRQLQ